MNIIPEAQAETETKTVRQTLTHLLGNVKDAREIRAYLEKFAAAGATQFAVIKLGGAILRDDLPAIAENLALLHDLGLKPIVIHGAGPQLDDALKAANVETPKIDGLRATPPAALPVMTGTTLDLTIRLVAKIQSYGTKAVPMPPSVVQAVYLDRDKYGCVGEPEKIMTDHIRAVIEADAIPVMSSLGQTADGQVVNINADSIVRHVALATEPMKILFVTGVGGLLDSAGRIINAINLESDYDDLMNSDWVNAGMRVKIREIKSLLDDMPLSSSVSITDAHGLVRELFTHGGAGTLVKRGEAIHTVTDAGKLDKPRMSRLFEDAFDRILRDDFWDTLDLDAVIVSDSFRCGALMSRISGAVLLDKFAVAPDARGEGLSRAIWRQICAAYPEFYWRAKRENSFNSFYYKEADGFVRTGQWNIFWIGGDAETDRRDIIRALADKPESFTGGGGPETGGDE